MFEEPLRDPAGVLATARALAGEQPEAAIATAQMAFEGFVVSMFAAVLATHGVRPPLAARIGAVVHASLMDKATRELWTELTGHKLQESPDRAWARYHQHVERRNGIIHGSGHASAADARESLAAIQDLMTAMIAMARARSGQSAST